MPKHYCCLGLLLLSIIFSCYSMELNKYQQRRNHTMRAQLSMSESSDSDDSFEESKDDTQQKVPSIIIKPPLAKYLAVKRVIEGFEFDINFGDNTNKNYFFSLIRQRRNSNTYICCEKKHLWRALKKHIKNDHEKDGKYVCLQTGCDKKVKSIVLMLAHIALHTIPNLFECPFCLKVLASEISIRKHFGLCTDIEDQERSDELDEEQYDQSGLSSDTHLQLTGKDEASYYKESVNNNTALHRGVYGDNATHKDIVSGYQQNLSASKHYFLSTKEYIDLLLTKCQCCGVTLRSWINGINHFYYIHRSGTEYYCPYHTCNKRYALPHDALCCMVQHINEHIFTCTICNARYNSYEMLLDHCETHTQEKIQKPLRLEHITSNMNNQPVATYHVTNTYPQTALSYSVPVYKSASDVVAEYQQPRNTITQAPYFESWSYAVPQQAWNTIPENWPYITRPYPQ